MKTEWLFAYGTLMSGEANHGWLRGAELRSADAYVSGLLADTGCGYPALFLAGGARVKGELYRVDWDRLGPGLDELETYYGPGDARNEYERVRVSITLGGTDGLQEPVQAWTYVYPGELQPPLRPIPSGDWRSVRRGRMV